MGLIFMYQCFEIINFALNNSSSSAIAEGETYYSKTVFLKNKYHDTPCDKLNFYSWKILNH